MNNINNINNINRLENKSLNNNPDKQSYDLYENLKLLQENMSKRCEYEVPEYGDFKKVVEIVKNNDESAYAGDISLICESSEDEPKKRYLSFNQMNPENRKGLNTLIASGDKDKILNTLKDEKFVDNLFSESSRLSDKMTQLKW